METKAQWNPQFNAIPRTARTIERLHNCADCPIRKLAARQPRSIFGRLHAWHRTWWPGWQAHQMRECQRMAASRTPSC